MNLARPSRTGKLRLPALLSPRRTFAPLLALLVTACGGPLATSTQFRGPDGSADWWSIECKKHDAACLREAGLVCPAGYTLGDKADHGAEANSSDPGGRGSSRIEPVTNGEMTIRCKGASMAHKTDPDCVASSDNQRPSWCPQIDHEPRQFLSDDPRAAGAK